MKLSVNFFCIKTAFPAKIIKVKVERKIYMKTNIKALLCAVLAVVIAGSVFAACRKNNNDNNGDVSNNDNTATTSSNASDGQTTLTVWAWDDNFNVKAAKIAADYYKKENPNVNVNVQSMAQTDIVQKLNAAFSAGNYEGLPDIVLIEDYRIQNYLTSYAGELKDLSSIVKKDAFMDYKLKVMTGENGEIYGVPFDSGSAALFYRTDYIKQAGYTDDDMKNITWDKYIEIGKAVKEKTGKSMLTLDPSDLGQLRMMMQSCGAWYVNDDGKTVNIKDNKPLREAIETYKKIIDSGIATQISGWDPFVKAFQNGDVATVPTGCWIAPSISAVEEQSGKWAVAPLPKMNISESVNYSNIGGASWYVINKSKNADVAVDFLGKTFASDTKLMNELADEINLVSTLKAAKDAENYKKENKFFSNQKIFEDFSSWTEKIPPVNYGLYTYSIEDIMTETVQSIVSGSNIDKALENAQKQAEASAVQ